MRVAAVALVGGCFLVGLSLAHAPVPWTLVGIAGLVLTMGAQLWMSVREFGGRR